MLGRKSKERYLIVAEPLDEPFTYIVSIYDTKDKQKRVANGCITFDLNMRYEDHGRNFSSGSITISNDDIKVKRVFSLFEKVFSKLLDNDTAKTAQTIKFWY